MEKSEVQKSIAANLRLKKNELRKLVVSVSGGLDSTVLVHAMSQLQKIYPLQLQLIHFNFHLRGRESDADEKFVRALAKKLDLPLKVLSKKISKKSGIQESARAARLKTSYDFLPDYEWCEAHHANDQVETFFFRLFRGSGLKGLSSIHLLSYRETSKGKRKVWRPLLNRTKKELMLYARKKNLKFREDSSNKTEVYDRNWIRLKLLPLVEKKYPHAFQSILRSIDEIQTVNETQNETSKLSSKDIVLNSKDHLWSWEKLKNLTAGNRQRFMHDYFHQSLKMSLSREHILGLEKKILNDESFAFNAPKGVVVRGRKKSRMVKEPQIRLCLPSAK